MYISSFVTLQIQVLEDVDSCAGCGQCQADMLAMLDDLHNTRSRLSHYKFISKYHSFFVKLRQGSGKDRQEMALQARGLKA